MPNKKGPYKGTRSFTDLCKLQFITGTNQQMQRRVSRHEANTLIRYCRFWGLLAPWTLTPTRSTRLTFRERVSWKGRGCDPKGKLTPLGAWAGVLPTP